MMLVEARPGGGGMVSMVAVMVVGWKVEPAVLKNRKFEWPNSPSQPTSDGFKELSLKPGMPGDGFGLGRNCVSDLNSIFCNRTFEI